MPNKTITRADLADALHQEVGLSLRDCRRLLGEVLGEIADALDRDEKVVLANFGTFAIRHKKERVGRNPKTGEPAVIAARRAVTFSAAGRMKAKVASRP